jgi:hypothetical protein
MGTIWYVLYEVVPESSLAVVIFDWITALEEPEIGSELVGDNVTIPYVNVVEHSRHCHLGNRPGHPNTLGITVGPVPHVASSPVRHFPSSHPFYHTWCIS